jgi:hypothetical protein
LIVLGHGKGLIELEVSQRVRSDADFQPIEGLVLGLGDHPEGQRGNHSAGDGRRTEE